MSPRTIEEVLAHIGETYGGFFDSHAKPMLDPINVPICLRPFIPYAQLWGVADDLERERRIKQSPQIARDDLLKVVRSIDDDLDEWLAGEEAYSPTPSREYIAFSAMRMAADFL
jgi:hypothetical protein